MTTHYRGRAVIVIREDYRKGRSLVRFPFQVPPPAIPGETPDGPAGERWVDTANIVVTVTAEKEPMFA